MGRYVQTALRPGESIVYDARVHWAVFISPLIRLLCFTGAALVFIYLAKSKNNPLGVSGLMANLQKVPADIGEAIGVNWLGTIDLTYVVSAIAVFIALQHVANALIYYFNSDFALTDRRIIAKFGLLSRSTSEQRLSKVESIQVYQSFLGRLLNFGNINVTGTGASDTWFGYMVDPVGCKHALEGQLDRVRSGHSED